MASAQSKFLDFLLRAINKKKILSKQFTNGKFGFFDSPEPPRKIHRSCRLSRFQINNRNVFTISPKNKGIPGKHILYLHGGGYVHSFVTFHWHFLVWLVKKTGCTITAPDYPLAPGNTYKESFAMVEVLYKELASRLDPGNLILMGDSAGGGFALALAQKMKHDHIDLPGQIILLSPWLDITLTNPDIKDIKGVDPLLGIESLQAAGKIYAGDLSPDHYLLSPINGNMEGLGKISVFMGSKDILVADTRKLKSIAALNGTEINYYEYTDMMHDWMLLNFPESKKAKQQIIEVIQSQYQHHYPHCKRQCHTSNLYVEENLAIE